MHSKVFDIDDTDADSATVNLSQRESFENSNMVESSDFESEGDFFDFIDELIRLFFGALTLSFALCPRSYHFMIRWEMARIQEIEQRLAIITECVVFSCCSED